MRHSLDAFYIQMTKKKTEQQLKEEFIIMNGFLKKKGYKFDMTKSILDNSFDTFFVTDEQFNQFVEGCVFYVDEEVDDVIFDDLDEAIDYLEEENNEKFEDWLKRRERIN